MTKSRQQLADRYSSVLITGASSGIGQAIARALLQKGLKVYGTSRDPDAPKLSKNIEWLKLDGSSQDGLNAFIENNTVLLSTIDILVNNSGSSSFGKRSDIPDAIQNSQHCLLYETPVKLTEQALPKMKSRQRGAIVNISSLAALFTLPYMEGYSKAKAALSAFSQGLIRENDDCGVTIIDFQPGDYRTAFNRNIKRYGEETPTSKRVWQRLEQNLDRAPRPEKAARDLLRALEGGVSKTICSGSFFQSKLAPLAHQILPKRQIRWATRKYYGI